MSSDWEMTRLGDLFEITSSKRVHKEDWRSEGIPFFRAREIVQFFQTGAVRQELYITPEMYHEFKSKYGVPQPEDLLVTGVGTLGVCYRVRDNVPFYFKDGNIIWLKKRNDSDSRFIEYAFQSDLVRDQIMSGSQGATVGTYTIEKANETLIPIPPLPEQQRIVTKLDAAFAALAEAQAHVERNRANARELFESYLNGVFEGKGETVRLDEVCEITSALVDPQLEDHIDLLHVGGGNIESKTGRLIDLKTAREEGLRSGKFLFDESMVLYNKIRPYLMKVTRPDFAGLCSADMYPLSPKPGLLDRDFLYYLLLSNHFTEYAIKGSDRAGMPKVNREHLFAYEFPLPPLKEQQQIAKELDALLPHTQALESTYQQKLMELEGLKKGLLGAAFRGEL